MMLLATTTVAQAGAQETPATCNGLTPTMIVTDIDEAAVGTPGDDIVIIELDIDVDFETEDFQFYLFLSLDGNDTICLRGDTAPILFAGPGNDTVIIESANAGTAGIYAGSGNDTITVDFTEDHYGYLRADGGPGDDTFNGGAGNDYFEGGSGNDTLRGAAGTDVLLGGAGDDEIFGGYGDDNLSGGDGDDTIYGSRGNDEITGDLGADTLYGGPGNDNMSSNVNFRMNPHAQTFEPDTAGARMFGGEGDDMLWGSDRWDRMQGGPGDDLLAGFEGRDYLRGGPGNDNLIGGTNIDDMNGNIGRDRIFIQGADKASGGYGTDECGGFSWEEIDIPASCENTFETTMAMVNMNMMNGGGD